MEGSNLKELKFFKVTELGDIHGGNVVSCDPRDCGWFDTVWCKQGDSCGTNDWLCVPGGPGGTGHDGCCTGSWDHLGDGREGIAVMY